MAPKLYIFKGSPAVRAVLVTAKALEIELELQEIEYFKEDHLSAEFLKRNPQHTVPTLDDNGIALCDSHAINAYLVRKFGKDDSLYPKDFVQRAIIDQRLHFDSGVMFSLLEKIEVSYLQKEIVKVPAHLIRKVDQAYGWLEKFLEGHQWIAGDNVTIADFSLITTTTSLNYHVEIDPKAYLNVRAWLTRGQALPCFSSDHEQLQCFVDLYNS